MSRDEDGVDWDLQRFINLTDDAHSCVHGELPGTHRAPRCDCWTPERIEALARREPLVWPDYSQDD